MPSLITNLSGFPLTLPEPYVAILRPGQGVTVTDEPATVIAALGGAARINGLLAVSVARQVDSGLGALPAEAGKYAKLAGAAFTGPVSCADVAALAQGAQLATVAALPTAAVALRGTLWIMRGGAGVADVMKVCVKNASDAYVWQTVTLT